MLLTDRACCTDGVSMSSRTESGSPEMKSKAAQAFVIEGELSVVNATTVICLRRAVSAEPRVLQCSRFDGMGGAMLKDRPEVAFRSGWQVLMGQAEVKNWMRSEPDSTTTMRSAASTNSPAALSTKARTSRRRAPASWRRSS